MPCLQVRPFHRWRPRVGEIAFQLGRDTRLRRGNLRAISDVVAIIEAEKGSRPHLGEFLEAWGAQSNGRLTNTSQVTAAPKADDDLARVSGTHARYKICPHTIGASGRSRCGSTRGMEITVPRANVIRLCYQGIRRTDRATISACQDWPAPAASCQTRSRSSRTPTPLGARSARPGAGPESRSAGISSEIFLGAARSNSESEVFFWNGFDFRFFRKICGGCF